MDRPRSTPLRIGAWRVDPALGEMSRDGETVRLEARTLRTLLCLAERAGQVVSIDELLDEVWAGVVVTPDSVYQAIASLRRTLGDDPKQPAYIATVPRLGYRLVAAVSPWTAPHGPPLPAASAEPAAIPAAAAIAPRRRGPLLWAAGLALAAVLAGLYFLLGPFPSSAGNHAAERAVAVMPFLDLTKAMDEEPFADGMTEELIDKLSRIPGLRVSARTSTFYFKRRKATIAEIAETLHVGYVLEGSVRKSGGTLRVTAQLVRADDGYLVWAGTYDRPASDILMIQDGIAAEVTRALAAGSLGGDARKRGGGAAQSP
ncbi:transcriptional regulator [Frateuria sp. Soil773]|uniref:winged helix-turn-helix domain-containing protein n=1 Tax=Frateuria sp. Soil773 TaxID=1736407 RepID=UPI000702019A|nr:winged helix-turn-helix domain-containing protein [Frateuria sp. Soil773]KRE89430.1 transcriptional regulator [Frateuria sp. Soil773]